MVSEGQDYKFLRMKHQSEENRGKHSALLAVFCFGTPRAKSQVLLENDSSDVCKVIEHCKCWFIDGIQKKYEKEYIATSVNRRIQLT